MNLYAICPVYTCWQIMMLTAQLQLWCLPSEYETLQSAQDAYKGQSIRSIYWTEIDWNEVKSTEGDQETHFFSWGASDELNYFHTHEWHVYVPSLISQHSGQVVLYTRESLCYLQNQKPKPRLSRRRTVHW